MKGGQSMICPNCGGDELHLKRITTVKESLPAPSKMTDLADFYKVMGDETRLKLLMSLDNGPLCVSDLSCILNMTLSAISHQLKILRVAKLVKSTKVGKVVYYELDDEHIKKILDMGLEHILERD